MSESNIQHFLHFIINWSLWGAPQSPILGGTVPLTPKKEANRVTTSSFGVLTREKKRHKTRKQSDFAFTHWRRIPNTICKLLEGNGVWRTTSAALPTRQQTAGWSTIERYCCRFEAWQVNGLRLNCTVTSQCMKVEYCIYPYIHIYSYRYRNIWIRGYIAIYICVYGFHSHTSYHLNFHIVHLHLIVWYCVSIAREELLKSLLGSLHLFTRLGTALSIYKPWR